MAAHTVTSSIGCALIPLATFPTNEHVGCGWGNTIIAMVNLGLCAIPLILTLMSRTRAGEEVQEVV